jgi:hypothetical protein
MSSPSRAPRASALTGRQKPGDNKQQEAAILGRSGLWDTFKPWETPYEPLTVSWSRNGQGCRLALLKDNVGLFATTHRYGGDDHPQKILYQALRASMPCVEKTRSAALRILSQMHRRSYFTAAKRTVERWVPDGN